MNDHVREVAIAAEKMGFGGIAVSDHVAMPKGHKSVHPCGRRIMEHDTLFPGCLITIATMAAVTTRLRFKHAVSPARHAGCAAVA